MTLSGFLLRSHPIQVEPSQHLPAWSGKRLKMGFRFPSLSPQWDCTRIGYSNQRKAGCSSQEICFCTGPKRHRMSPINQIIKPTPDGAGFDGRNGLSLTDHRNHCFKNPGEMFHKDTSDKSYDRYKQIQYRNLIVKALLSFFFGLLCGFIFKLF